MEHKAIFICDFNGWEKIFTTKYSLIRHNQTHKKKKDFKWKECEKTFSIRQNLIEHEFVHTGELPYLWNVNGWQERFRQRGKLSLHRQSHKTYNKKSYRSHAAINCGETDKSSNIIANELVHNRLPNTPAQCSFSSTMNSYNINFYMMNNQCVKMAQMTPVNIANRNFNFMQTSMTPTNVLRRQLEPNFTKVGILPKLSVILMPNYNFGRQF
jgi:hypothetical protein